MKYLLLFFICFSSCFLSSQNSSPNESAIDQQSVVIDLKTINNDSKRDEIQRYIGYETLLARYLTLPYDISVNSSNQGRYFDIGYGLLIIIPIALLAFTYSRKRLFYTLAVLFIFLLGFLKYYSFVNISGVGPVQRSADNWEALSSSADSPFIEEVTLGVDYILVLIARPLITLVESISGSEDHLTYGVLLSIILLGFFFMSLFKEEVNPSKLFLVSTCLGFVSIWLILSGGIIWYGFLAIPFLFSISFKLIDKAPPNFPKIICILSVASWLVLAYFSRISNIESYQPKSNWGKNILNNNLIHYSTAINDSDKARDMMFRNISSALSQINSSQGMIYQVGTSLAYEIRENTKRVIQDNTLIMFYAFAHWFNLNEIPNALKESGVEYIILDLYTPTLDRTPEKSLTKKYKLLVASLYENSDVKLIATDRVLNLVSEDGQKAQLNHIFAKGYANKFKIEIAEPGSYAIFQIMD